MICNNECESDWEQVLLLLFDIEPIPIEWERIRNECNRLVHVRWPLTECRHSTVALIVISQSVEATILVLRKRGREREREQLAHNEIGQEKKRLRSRPQFVWCFDHDDVTSHSALTENKQTLPWRRRIWQSIAKWERTNEWTMRGSTFSMANTNAQIFSFLSSLTKHFFSSTNNLKNCIVPLERPFV